MAIHPTEEPERAHPIDIEAWTEQTTVAFSDMHISISGPLPDVHSALLEIPLDEHPEPRPAVAMAAATTSGAAGQYRRKEPVRRDNLNRREALKKGNEGSRRRQRWENDRLLANPYAEPPTAKDWEVRATHPVHHVPYYLAPLWDAGLARQHTERKTAAVKARPNRTVAKKPTEPGVVPKELREKLKKARGAKGLLMDIEQEVRGFVERCEAEDREAEASQDWSAEPDSSDDEVVFAGRSGGQQNGLQTPQSSHGRREMMVFETALDDQSGTFGRWLVHHIGTYYGLQTWSVTRGNPAMREAYIGVKEPTLKAGRPSSSTFCLPRPLWGII